MYVLWTPNLQWHSVAYLGLVISSSSGVHMLFFWQTFFRSLLDACSGHLRDVLLPVLPRSLNWSAAPSSLSKGSIHLASLPGALSTVNDSSSLKWLCCGTDTIATVANEKFANFLITDSSFQSFFNDTLILSSSYMNINWICFRSGLIKQETLGSGRLEHFSLFSNIFRQNEKVITRSINNENNH